MSAPGCEGLAVVQARMSSSRLPGKVLLDVSGRTALWHVMHRLGHVRGVDAVVVAVPDRPEDDVLAAYVLEQGWALHRGSRDDVLDRTCEAARAFSPRYVVRVTSDATLLDPFLLSAVIQAFRQGGYEYASNCLQPSYPDGLDVEVMAFSALERAWREAREPAEREHVTPFIRTRPEEFRCVNVRQGRDLSAMCWALDTPEDLEFLRRVTARLDLFDPRELSFARVIALLRSEPGLMGVNAGSKRDWKLLEEIPHLFAPAPGAFDTIVWEGE